MHGLEEGTRKTRWWRKVGRKWESEIMRDSNVIEIMSYNKVSIWPWPYGILAIRVALRAQNLWSVSVNSQQFASDSGTRNGTDSTKSMHSSYIFHPNRRILPGDIGHAHRGWLAQAACTKKLVGKHGESKKSWKAQVQITGNFTETALAALPISVLREAEFCLNQSWVLELWQLWCMFCSKALLHLPNQGHSSLRVLESHCMKTRPKRA